MATPQQPSDSFSTLQTDVALLKQFNEKVVEPYFKQINDKLDGLAYVPQTEFDDLKRDVDRRFGEMKKHTWIQNTLSAIMGALLSALITYIVLGWLK